MLNPIKWAKGLLYEVYNFFTYKNNILFALFGALFLIAYQSAQFYIEMPTDYVTFAPDLTIWLQDIFSSRSLDMFFSYYYPVGFITCLVILCYLMIKEGKDGWKWGVALMGCWILHFIIEMYYPVAPPLRWDSGARPIRLEVFPLSDSLVSVKYGGLPSGHFGYTLLAFLIAKFKLQGTGNKDYKKYMYYLLANLLLITFTVFYLGEHTWEDIFASLIIFGGIFYITSQFISEEKHVVNKTISAKKKAISTAFSLSTENDKKEKTG